MASFFIWLGTTATLICAPIAALLVVRDVSLESSSLRNLIYRVATTVFVLATAAAILNLSFSALALNALALCLSYCSFALLSLSAFRLKPKPVGISIGIICSLPLLGGVILATAGFFLLMGVVSDSIPVYEGNTESGDTCHVYNYGGILADYGQAGSIVEVYQAVLPGIEHRVIESRLPEETLPPNVLCGRIGTANAGSQVSPLK